ncbi:aminodeoxychorismate synthase component I [Kineococcus sp. T13]|nr:aminodeoxychorismate synthase component I [Kineococcus vitellinus]
MDNHDSYTHNLVQLLAVATGADPVVLSDDDVAPGELDLAGFAGVVLSPGPGHPANPRDFALSADVLRRSEVPVLGVCLGMQGIALAAGAAVEAAPQPLHGHVDRVRHTATSLLAGLPQGFAATRYHSFRVAEPLPAQLEPLAWAEDGVLMALRHRTRPQVGVQFHPESVASTGGERIVENFVRWCGGALPAGAGRRATGTPASARPAPRFRVLAERTGPAVDAEAAFTHLFGASTPAFWLDSAARGAGSGRFSFLGDGTGPLARELPAGPGVLDRLAAELELSGVEGAEALPFPFAGGFVGWAGYELRAECGYPAARRDDLPAAAWLFCDRFVAVDHERDATWLVALVERDGPAREEQERAAREWSRRTARSLRRLPQPPPPPAPPAVPAVLDTPPPRYREQVLAAQEQLRAGESYEVCLTTQARVPAVGDPLDAYRRLRRANPAPYAAFLRLGGAVVAGSSPERFLHVDAAGEVETRPVKGTAALGTDPLALRADPKTRAENLMVVDLLRHDLGRVCAPGTVVVPDLMAVETLPTVHQLVTTVRGRLRPGAGAVDCLRSCFPPGSMTGAPKLRTTEIVDALEQRPRGVYSGTLGWLSTTGAADLAVVIRTAVLVPAAGGGEWRVGAGGAVVLDSDPDAEVAEVLLKLRAPLAALTSEPLSP